MVYSIGTKFHYREKRTVAAGEVIRLRQLFSV